MACLLILSVGVAAMLGKESHWARNDAERFHVPYIEKIASAGLIEAFIEPEAAMPPLYHAAANSVKGLFHVPAYTAGRILSFASFVILVLALYYQLGITNGHQGYWHLCGALLLLSWPLVTSALSPVTDTFGCMAFVGALLCFRQGRTWPLLFLVPSAVLTRQYYAFLVGAIFGTLILDGVKLTQRPHQYTLHKRVALLGAFAAGFAALVLIVLAWKGIVPPRFALTHEIRSGLNGGAVSLSLAYLGMIVCLALGLKLIRLTTSDLMIGGALGVIAYLILPADLNFVEGRWGSPLWNLSTLPGISPFNPFFLLFFATFFAYTGRAIRQMKQNGISSQTAFFGLSSLGILFVFSIQPFAWQRYIDPMLSITFVLLMESIERHEKRSGP